MFTGKLPKPRGFEYNCRFYTPVAEEEEKHISFRRIRKSEPSKRASVVRLLVVLAILVAMFSYLRKIGTPFSAFGSSSGPIVVEEVIVVD